MPASRPSDSHAEACPICPTQEIHAVHEQLDEFESLRSLRREKRVSVWAGSILRAARNHGLQMTAEEADDLAWKLQDQVENDLRS